MSMMNAELYDALISVKVPEDKARKAASSVLGQEQVATKADIADLQTQVAELRVTLRVVVALLIAVLALLLAPYLN